MYVMRPLLVTVLLVFSFAGFSQSYPWKKLDLGPKYPLYRHDKQDFYTPYRDSFPSFQMLVPQFPKMSGVFILPQDNMPCLVPPSPTAGLIPNFWYPQYRGSIGFMPNPAQPFKLEE